MVAEKDPGIWAQVDPAQPGLDDETRQRRQVLKRLRALSPQEFFSATVHAGIYEENGELAEPYRTSQSVARPTD